MCKTMLKLTEQTGKLKNDGNEKKAINEWNETLKKNIGTDLLLTLFIPQCLSMVKPARYLLESGLKINALVIAHAQRFVVSGFKYWPIQ